MGRFQSAIFLVGAVALSFLSATTSGFTAASRSRVSVRGFHSALCSEGDDYSEYIENGEDSSATSRPGRRRPLRRSTSSSATSAQEQLETRRQEAQKRHVEALKDPTLLTKVTFADRADMAPATKRAIAEVLGLQRMTEIQAKTYAAALEGQNVLGRARTGTGKTLAFLLPSIERLLEADLDLFKPGLSIGMIIVAPTRELAMQIADQAESLLTFHKDMDVACVYGGTKIQRDTRLLSGPRLPAILVATPGRLLEHCESTRIGRRKFSDIAQETHIVVLDEADRLLDGFAKESQKILSFLPRAEKRQTLLFSATVSKKLRGFVKESMKIDYTEIDCLNDRNIRGETNNRVEQSYMVLKSIDDYIPTLVSIINRAMKEKDFKILVFFPASKLVRFFVNFFNIGLDIPVLEIHSRMSQASRTRASNTFRSTKNAILFSSDISARGVDYPDVSMVIQVRFARTILCDMLVMYHVHLSPSLCARHLFAVRSSTLGGLLHS
jgi:ATP-dependent RNA helicase MSS116